MNSAIKFWNEIFDLKCYTKYYTSNKMIRNLVYFNILFTNT